ncbi:hypothetical protein KSF78_0005384 [Schistosoma japonicum]|nr:hypothetical protein KSF78_0005384 [Schistosoma japonicum]
MNVIDSRLKRRSRTNNELSLIHHAVQPLQSLITIDMYISFKKSAYKSFVITTIYRVHASKRHCKYSMSSIKYLVN